MNAEAWAEHKGFGFAAHLTMHWRCDPAFDPKTWGRRQTRFFDKLRRWLERNRITAAFAWVNEHGREYGEHLHLLLYLPKPKRNAEKSFKAITADLAAWIATTEKLATDKVDRFGNPWPPVKITGGRYGMRNRNMRSGVCRYLLKGIDPSDVAYTGFGAEQRAAFLGIKPKANAEPIKVQRSGTSRNLGPKARRGDASWSDLRSLVELHARLNPT